MFSVLNKTNSAECNLNQFIALYVCTAFSFQASKRWLYDLIDRGAVYFARLGQDYICSMSSKNLSEAHANLHANASVLFRQ